MRVLVTRPNEDAEQLVAALAARGHAAVVEPMFHVAFLDDVAPIDLSGVQAVLFTSANGVRAFARLSSRRDLPAFAVGDASAAVARAAGFAAVESAGGDVGDLARLVAARLTPADGALFHGAARIVAGDLKGALEAAGFTVRRAVLYETQATQNLSPALRTALERGEVDAATFFSPRTAETFVKLLQDEGLAPVCTSLAAVCLSAAVAEKVRVLSWRSVRIAAEPNQDALLACIEDMVAGPESSAVEGAMPEQDTTEPQETGGPGAGNGNGKGDEGGQAAHDIIAKFGGIRPMASKLGIAVSTVQGWRERGSIPSARHHQILSAADAHHIEIDAETLAASDRAPEGHAEHETVAPSSDEGARAEPTSAVEAESPEETAEEGPAEALVAPAALAARPAGKGSWLVGFIAAAIVFAIGAGAAVLTRDVWAPPPAPAPAPASTAGPTAEQVAGLEKRVADLDSKLADLESKPAPAADTARLDEARSAITSLRDEVSKLRGDLDSLQSRVASIGTAGGGGGDTTQLAASLSEMETRNTDLAKQVSGLEDRNADLAKQVSDLEARNTDLAGKISAIEGKIGTMAETGARTQATESAVALAALQMRDALRGAAPFETELQTIKKVAANAAPTEAAALRDAVAPLEPYAATGAPSLASLKAEFPAVARKAIAQASGGEGTGLWSNVIRRISGLVSIRPVGPVEGEGATAIVARAESHLDGGDLAAAVKELDGLKGPAAEAAAPWRKKAEARLAAEAALIRLGQILATAHAGANG